MRRWTDLDLIESWETLSAIGPVLIILATLAIIGLALHWPDDAEVEEQTIEEIVDAP